MPERLYRNGNERLTDRQIGAIRYLYAIRALNQDEIAVRFHTTQAHVSHLVRKTRRRDRKPLRPLYRVLSNGCWEWQLSRGENGYGHIKTGGRMRLAHRYVYEQHRGPIPNGLQLDHLCRNRACVNPEHLQPVTCAENHWRGRQAKLTVAAVVEIRRLLGIGVRQRVIAERFGVRQDTISRIKAGRRWREAS
jgi:predicted XRE-type DNA-binding protein